MMTELQLGREYLPATGTSRQELVLLHGWGCNREIWRPLLTKLRPWANITLLDIPGAAPGSAPVPELDELLAAIVAHCPAQAVYLGWSLGGQIAVELAHRFPERVIALATICYNPCFVDDGHWPGMAPGDFAVFESAVIKNPGLALRRFDSLQAQGAQRPRTLLRELQTMRKGTGSLHAGLQWLRDLDQRQLLPAISQPQIHMHTELDALVPVAASEAVQELLRTSEPVTVQAISGACHLAPLESSVEIADYLQAFLQDQQFLEGVDCSYSPLDKRDVADSFSRAAASYDSVAQLQRDVGKRLLSSLDEVAQAPARVLDLGCGTGFFKQHLQQRFPQAEYVGLDLAPGMVAYARQHHPQEGAWLVGDAESLPLATDSVDLIFSSLAIQWCYRPDLLFAELARVLRLGGRCVFTSLGPETLCELRGAWAAVDHHQHVNSFLPAAELEQASGQLPGVQLRLDSAVFRMQYPRVRDLLAELKALGAHNVNRDRPSGLTGRASLQGMLRAYEGWRKDGMLPATYDVLFGVLEAV